jgi:hypothetical protein
MFSLIIEQSHCDIETFDSKIRLSDQIIILNNLKCTFWYSETLKSAVFIQTRFNFHTTNARIITFVTIKTT